MIGFRKYLSFHKFLILLLCISVGLNIFYFMFFFQKKQAVLGEQSINTEEILQLINKERKDQKLNLLKINSKLTDAASAKTNHMFSAGYWGHFAPDGTSPWKFIKNSGYNYAFAGENLAKNYNQSKNIVNSWMNSPTHRKNILSNNFEDIGLFISRGEIEGKNVFLVTVIFGSQKNKMTNGEEVIGKLIALAVCFFRTIGVAADA